MNECGHDFHHKRFGYERDGMDWWKLDISICRTCGEVKREIIKSETSATRPDWFKQ